MNVFRSWCQCRHLEYVSIETMAPEELDKVLSKFYAEVKNKKDGDDYEPESLKIMHSAIERYLKEKNYPLSIVRSREFHSSQEIHKKSSMQKQFPCVNKERERDPTMPSHIYTVVLPKKEFDVEVFVQIRFILLYNHNIN